MKRCHFNGCGKRGGLFPDRVEHCDNCGCSLDKISAAELEIAIEEEDRKAQEALASPSVEVPVIDVPVRDAPLQ